MTDIFENDKKFKEAIGAFIIAFSELEYGLAFLNDIDRAAAEDNQKFVLTLVRIPVLK